MITKFHSRRAGKTRSIGKTVDNELRAERRQRRPNWFQYAPAASLPAETPTLKMTEADAAAVPAVDQPLSSDAVAGNVGDDVAPINTPVVNAEGGLYDFACNLVVEL